LPQAALAIRKSKYLISLGVINIQSLQDCSIFRIAGFVEDESESPVFLLPDSGRALARMTFGNAMVTTIGLGVSFLSFFYGTFTIGETS